MKKFFVLLLFSLLINSCTTYKDIVLRDTSLLTRHEKRIVHRFLKAVKQHNKRLLFKTLSKQYIQIQYLGTSMSKKQFIDELFCGDDGAGHFYCIPFDKITEIHVKEIYIGRTKTIIFKVEGDGKVIDISLELYKDGFFGGVG